MFSQWEHSREAQNQLTDELQANQSQLRESQAKVGLCEGLVLALNEQVDDLKQQVCAHICTHMHAQLTMHITMQKHVHTVFVCLPTFMIALVLTTCHCHFLNHVHLCIQSHVGSINIS